MKTTTFTSYSPSAPYALGEITWQADLVCSECGELDRVHTITQWYDGLIRETPKCPVCGKEIAGLPIDPHERAIVIKQRKTQAAQQ